MYLCVNRKERHTNVEGPGTRFCIWTQGCDICCPGCANKEMWKFGDGIYISTDEVISEILAERGTIEGVTFLGGEPICQAKAILEIASAVHENGLSTVLFTGHTYEELTENDCTEIQSLLHITDLLIDGPFIEELKDFSRPWVGSSNQRYFFLSNRYKEIETNILHYQNHVEIRISSGGVIAVNGMWRIGHKKGSLLIDGDDGTAFGESV